VDEISEWSGVREPNVHPLINRLRKAGLLRGRVKDRDLWLTPLAKRLMDGMKGVGR
jgi:hypothetical protein